jgi:hypothetical protein
MDLLTFLAQKPVHDPSFTLENLSAGATVRISIKATNSTGESAIVGPVEANLG